MGYVSHKESLRYLEEHLEEMFSKKEVKNNRKELLNGVYDLIKQCEFVENDQLLSFLVVESYRNYNELLKMNPNVRKFFDLSYHKIYIHARYSATYSYVDGTIEEQLKQEYQNYCKEYMNLKPSSMSLKHYEHLIKIAFLNEKIERFNLKKKKIKTLNVEEANLIKEYELEKALIY